MVISYVIPKTAPALDLLSTRMCEETYDPSIQVPKAIVGTVILNALAGLLFLVPLVFVLPSLDILVNLTSGQPLPTILRSAVGSSSGAFGLLIPLMVLALICGVGCTTATSRCIYAFARDGGIPGSGWWKKIDRRLEVPLNALGLSGIVQILLGLIYFGSTAAFNAFSGAGVIFLTVSYAVPIAVCLFGGRAHLKNSRFNLGPFGIFCNVVALCKFRPNWIHSSSTNDADSVKHQVGLALQFLSFVCHRIYQLL